MFIKKVILLPVLLVTACSNEPSDWIEVPLQEKTYYPQTQSIQQAEFEIAVPAEEGLEFKLSMKQGDVIVYHWTTEIEVPALLRAEFHGHTERQGDEPGTVMFYTQHHQDHEEGSLVAPFDGIHGWYLRNDSGEDIVVKLSVAGFFETVKEEQKESN